MRDYRQPSELIRASEPREKAPADAAARGCSTGQHQRRSVLPRDLMQYVNPAHCRLFPVKKPRPTCDGAESGLCCSRPSKPYPITLGARCGRRPDDRVRTVNPIATETFRLNLKSWCKGTGNELSSTMALLFFPDLHRLGRLMKTRNSIAKRSVGLSGHKTSLHLEEGFWTGLKEAAQFRNVTVAALVTEIYLSGEHANLSSAVRVFVLNYFRGRLGLPAEGWQRRPNLNL
jgi:predicted DNA-binding ribbon-helix-helix protein